MTSNVSRERPERPWLAFLRVASLIAVLAGAVGSIGLMLHTGSRQRSLILIGLFTAWVLSPFVALVCAHVVSKQWPAVTRAMLYSMMLILTLGSLVSYGDVALGPPRPKPASVFLVVPLTSWLLIAIVISAGALLSRRLSQRGDRA
jgi:hypothetical protein